MRAAAFLIASFVLAFILGTPAAKAQNPVLFASAASLPGSDSEGGATGTVTLMGYVSAASGRLPGAVVKFAGTKLLAVTDADGMFHLEVPASTNALNATATYLGYADTPFTVNANGPAAVEMTTPVALRFGKKYQTKAYLKKARRQMRRTLRRL